MPAFTKKYGTCWVWGKAHGSVGLTFIYYWDRDTKKEFSSIRTATVQIRWQMVTEACLSIGETRMSRRDGWNGECAPHLNWSHTQCLSLVPWSPEGQGCQTFCFSERSLKSEYLCNISSWRLKIFQKSLWAKTNIYKLNLSPRPAASSDHRLKVLSFCFRPLHMPFILPGIFFSRVPSLSPS